MKVLEIINSLSNQEKTKFKLFLDSKYHNKDTRLLILFEQLDASLKTKLIPNRSQLWAHLFPGEKLNDGLLRHLLSNLQSQLLRFCAIDRFINDEKSVILREADAIMEKNLRSSYPGISKKINQFLHEKENRRLDVTTKFLLVKKSGDLHEFFEGLSSIKNVEYASSLLNFLDAAIIDFYNTEKIRNALLASSITQKLGDEYLLNLKLQEYNISNLRTVSNEISEYFLNLLKLVKDNDGYDKLSELISFVPHLLEIDRTDALIAFETIHNYLIKGSNAGWHKDYRIDFKLYKAALEAGLFLKQGVIDGAIYRNTVYVACRVEEFNWALEFVEQYKNCLHPEIRQSAYSFSKARIFRGMGKFEEVVQVLQNVKYEDLTFNLNSRLILMMAYYELDEYQALISTINAFKVFLRRRKNISLQRKKNFLDFCQVVYHLVISGERRDVDRIKSAKELMSNNPGIPSSTWLKEKILELSQVLGTKEEISQN